MKKKRRWSRRAPIINLKEKIEEEHIRNTINKYKWRDKHQTHNIDMNLDIKSGLKRESND